MIVLHKVGALLYSEYPLSLVGTLLIRDSLTKIPGLSGFQPLTSAKCRILGSTGPGRGKPPREWSHRQGFVGKVLDLLGPWRSIQMKGKGA